MPDQNAPRIGREDIAPAVGRRLVVRCDRPNCGHAAIIDPRKVFGGGRDWPSEGRSRRFRCVCGSRESKVSYTNNADASDGPIGSAALALWF